MQRNEEQASVNVDHEPMSASHDVNPHVAFTCEICGKTFSRKDSYKRHGENCKHGVPYTTQPVQNKNKETPMETEDSGARNEAIPPQQGGADPPQDCRDAIAGTLRSVIYFPTANN